uniref:Uncharacterized protein n=2 Tax=Sphaerodactylus townsendi TaxID=933632 RepID=A0ACB8FGI3_9SAUR
MKQKRKQKRNRKTKGAAVKEVKKTDHQTHSDKDWSQSPDEDSEDNGKFKLVLDEFLEEVIADGEVDSANESSLKYSDLQKGSFCVSGLVDPVASDKPLPIDILSGNDPSSTNLPFVANKNVTELLSSDYLPDEIQNERLVDTKNSILEPKNQCSPPRSGYADAENSPVLSAIEDKAVPTKAISKLGPGRKMLGNKKELSVFLQQETSKKMERNTWAFFCCDLVDEDPHAVSGKNELCPTWPECLSNVIYEQRPRKTKKLKQVFSERTTELSDNKSNKSNKDLEKGGDGAVLNERDDRIDCCLPSPLSEMPGTETSNFHTKFVNNASDVALLASPTGKGRCRRIFNLAPNFDLPRQIPARKYGKVLRNGDVLIEPENVSDDSIRGEDKQSLRCHESPAPHGFAVIVDSLRLDVESLSVPANLTEPVDSSKKGVASQIQICTSSLIRDGQVVTPNKTLQTNTSRRNMPPNISTTQPDILYSVKATTEYLVNPVPEQCKNMHQINKLGATKHSRIEDDQSLLSIKSNSLRLPLSLGFALQLVELFGSPLVPLDTLLPDDYVVPLDCTISKEIYLQWKASVEKKQQKDRSKGYTALPAGAAALEASREVDDQEKPESSDANPQIYLFQ